MLRFFAALFVAVLSFFFGTFASAQLPERVNFQPGTFGFGGDPNLRTVPIENQRIVPKRLQNQFLNPKSTPEGVNVIQGRFGRSRPMPNSYRVKTLNPNQMRKFASSLQYDSHTAGAVISTIAMPASQSNLTRPANSVPTLATPTVQMNEASDPMPRPPSDPATFGDPF